MKCSPEGRLHACGPAALLPARAFRCPAPAAPQFKTRFLKTLRGRLGAQAWRTLETFMQAGVMGAAGEPRSRHSRLALCRVGALDHNRQQDNHRCAGDPHPPRRSRPAPAGWSCTTGCGRRCLGETSATSDRPMGPPGDQLRFLLTGARASNRVSQPVQMPFECAYIFWAGRPLLHVMT